jgi:hypothetical protein
MMAKAISRDKYQKGFQRRSLVILRKTKKKNKNQTNKPQLLLSLLWVWQFEGPLCKWRTLYFFADHSLVGSEPR